MNTNVDQLTLQIKHQQAEKLLAVAQQWPVGSRWTTADGDLATVVGFDCDLEEPWLLADYLLDGEPQLETPENFAGDPSALTRADDDIETADRARALSRGRGVPQHPTLWDTPATAGQILAVRAFLDATYAQIEADRAARKAAELRSERIAAIAGLCGSQTAAARLLGIDQSTVSRAINSLPVIP
ncbi:helix-turn-helix domain-containing protein [Streptacidiphilus sp. PAMC 29251]